MGTGHLEELEISERSWRQAVLAAKIVEAAGDPRELVESLRKQAVSCLSSETASKRTFGLHLLRFLYKKDLISIRWMLKRRIRALLKSDSSESVRLAAFDLLGAILSRTGSTSGVRESHYSTLLEFRERMLARAPALREYEASGVQHEINRLKSGEGTKATLGRIMAGIG